MAEFHETFGWIAIGVSGAAAATALGFAIARPELPRWFWWLGGAAITSMVVQVLAGVYLYQQDGRAGHQQVLCGFVILVTLTFG